MSGHTTGQAWWEGGGLGSSYDVARLRREASGLLDAARFAQCACSIRERDSGHLLGCWMPALSDAIAKAVSK